MHEAEIAATLLNRWQRNDRSSGSIEIAMNLLREGGLSCTHYSGVSTDTSDEFTNGVEIECLTFDDGSRVLRLNPRGAVRNSIGWAAVAPLPRASDE